MGDEFLGACQTRQRPSGAQAQFDLLLVVGMVMIIVHGSWSMGLRDVVLNVRIIFSLRFNARPSRYHGQSLNFTPLFIHSLFFTIFMGCFQPWVNIYSSRPKFRLHAVLLLA